MSERPIDLNDRSKAHLWWIIALALSVRVAVIPILGPDNESLFEYGQIAWNIVQGHGFSYDFEGRFPLQPTAYSPALYCYTLVPWFALFGIHLTGPRIMHALFLAGVCWFLYKIGERLVNRRVGLISAAIWAVYPEMIFLGIRIAIENAMFIPMTWALWKAQKMTPDSSVGSAVACGALVGVSAWVNPSLQILGAIIPVFWLINGIFKGQKGLKLVSLFVAGAIMVVSPWAIRNYIKLGAFVPLRTAFAYNVWRGNHIGATGTVRNLEGVNIDEVLPDGYREYVEAHMVPDEIERDRFFAGEVRRFIFEHPDQYLRLTLTRLFYYWWRDKTHPLTSNPLYLVPWMVVLGLAVIGAIRVRKSWKTWSLWGLQIIGFTILFSLTIVVPRYRMPIYPAIFLLAATGIEYAWRQIRLYLSVEKSA